MDIRALLPWVAAIGAGLLIGIERERSQAPESPAGVRSFVLAALAGAIGAALGPVALAVTLAALAALALLGYAQTRRDDPGMTTEIALLLTALLGALAQRQPAWAAGLAALVAGLLAAKALLHRAVRQVLTTREMQHGLLLAAAVLVVLPLLPDAPLPWLAGLNLHTLWLLAVVMMALESLGHIALRALGAARGLPLAGLAGGLVSSTATIAGMARLAAQSPALLLPALRGALLSNVATALEMALLVALLLPALLARLALPLAAYTAAVLAAVWLAGRTLGGGQATASHSAQPSALPPSTPASPPTSPAPPTSTPTSPSSTPASSSVDATGAAAARLHDRLHDLAAQPPFHPVHALGFAAVLSLVLLLAAALQRWIGPQGLVVGAALAGFADAHSAAASAAQLAAGGALPLAAATVAVGLALSTNAVSKVLAGFSAGDRRFGVWTAATQAAQIAAFWAVWGLESLLIN